MAGLASRSMRVRGYLVEAEWDGETLTARGTNKVSNAALLGEDHAAGEVSIPKEWIASVVLKEPKLFGGVNGNLVVTTVEGKRYQLHFRKKSLEEFRALAQALQS